MSLNKMDPVLCQFFSVPEESTCDPPATQHSLPTNQYVIYYIKWVACTTVFLSCSSVLRQLTQYLFNSGHLCLRENYTCDPLPPFVYMWPDPFPCFTVHYSYLSLRSPFHNHHTFKAAAQQQLFTHTMLVIRHYAILLPSTPKN